MNYYSEWDAGAAAWLRQLIEDGIIPKGHVDERSIVEVTPSDLAGYVQCHFFAGVAGWPLALKLAGWPEDRPVWTASLPCQSFSSAGKQRGTADERHLWPVFERLVRECRPPVLFGEQVASKLARTDWLPGVCLDLQNLGYSATAVDICAPCAGEVGEGRIVRGDQEAWERIILGAPHIRQRLYWVACRMADTDGGRHGTETGHPGMQAQDGQELGVSERDRESGRMADTRSAGCEGRVGSGETGEEGTSGGHTGECRESGRMDDPDNHEHDSHRGRNGEAGGIPGVDRAAVCAGESRGAGGRDGWKRVSFAADCLGEPGDECSICGLTYAEDCECPGPTHDGYEYTERDGTLYVRWVGDTGSEGSQGHAGNGDDGGEPGRQHQEQARPAWETSWADSDTILCADGKARRFERSIFPLASGLPRGVVPSGDPGSAEYANATGEARVMRLKGYGNAICAPLAAMFISTCMEVIDG
jgi:DNA (cytosine-5)-methyltransferase 1